MLSDDKPKIYWDACVPLSYINGNADRLPDIEGLMQRSGQDFYLVTSIYSIVEVAFAQIEQQQTKLDPEQEEKIAKLWQNGSPIQMIEFYELLAQKAQSLMRAAIPEGWSLQAGDAIHLATADHLKVVAFHTYDKRLDKFEKITESHFKIVRPAASQPVLILTTPTQPSATEAIAPVAMPAHESAEAVPAAQLTDITPEATPTSHSGSNPDEPAAGDSQKNHQLEANPTHPPAVRGSDEGRAEGQAAAEPVAAVTQAAEVRADIPPEKPKAANEGGPGGDGS